MEIHDPNRLKKYSCDVCTKKFNTKAQLKNHMFTHSDVKLFKCNICDNQFKYEITLKSHLNRVHKESNINIQKQKCNLCGKDYLQLEAHVKRIHSY